MTSKSQHPKTDDWAAARGEKWRKQLDGLEATLRPVDEPLIQALALDGARRVADVGCGGGATTVEIWRRAATALVHGFDLSPALVEAARSRIPASDSRIAFVPADMETAAPPGPAYDRLLSRFGIMFFADPPAAFANLHRWLAPEGRFAFAVWGPMADNAWMTTIREAVTSVIELPAVDVAAPGPFRYGEVAALLGLLAGAGFARLEVADWRGTLPIGGRRPAPDAAAFALAAFSSFAETLAEAGDDAVARAGAALTARFARHERDGAVWMPARVHLVTGTA